MKTLIAALKRALANLIRIGIVSEVDTVKGLCRVKMGELETDWLNWLTPRAGRVRFWGAPSVGEQVIILSIGGELTTAFVLPAVFSDSNPAPSASADAIVVTFPDGARFEYEPTTRHLAITGMKTANIVAETSITLTTPVVKCTQHLITRTLLIEEGGEARGHFNHSGGNLTSNGIVVHTHQHGGVKGGGDSSGGPQ